MVIPTDRGAAGTDGSLEIENITTDFSDAFNEALGKEKSTDEGTSGTSGDVLESGDIQPDKSSITPSDLGTEGTAAVASTSGVATTSADETAEQRYRSLQGIHKADKKKWEAEKKALEAEKERLKAEKEALASSTSGSPPSSDPYIGLTDKEKDELKSYDSEYDQVSKMEGLKRKVELNALKGEITTSIQAEFKEAFDFLLKSIAPALSTTEEISDERHFGAIKSAHSDFETYRDDGSIESWIDTKPKYLKDAYTQVYNEGTAQDIIDLIATFKRENNIGVSQVVNDQGTAGTTAAPPIDKKKQEKKEALSGVHSRKTPTSFSQIDKDNYDGAFEEAAKKPN